MVSGIVWRQSIRSLSGGRSACLQVAAFDAVPQPDGTHQFVPVIHEGLIEQPPHAAAAPAPAPAMSPAEAVVAAGRELVGRLRWRGESGALDSQAGWWPRENTSWGHPNDMVRWLLGTGPEPDENATMNCWEAVLFTAYRAGVVTRDRLREIHDEAARAAVDADERTRQAGTVPGTHHWPWSDDGYGNQAVVPQTTYYASLMASLYTGQLRRYRIDWETQVGGPDIPAGHLVFFNGTDHVALSLGTRDGQGRQQVLSMLNLPGSRIEGEENVGFMQLTSIEELVEIAEWEESVIEYAAPSWANPATLVMRVRVDGPMHTGLTKAVERQRGKVLQSLIDGDPGNPEDGKALRTAYAHLKVLERQLDSWRPPAPRPRAADLVRAGSTASGPDVFFDAPRGRATPAKLTLARLTKIAEKVREFGRTLPAGEVQVCLNLVTELVHQLHPRGVRPVEWTDDLATGSVSAARFLNLPPARWARATSWQALIGQVPVGGVTIVVFEQPGRRRHALALVGTTSDGVQIVDPHSAGDLRIRPVSAPGADGLRAGLPALINARAVTIDADGAPQEADPLARQADSIVDALTDPADPRVAAPATASGSGTGQVAEEEDGYAERIRQAFAYRGSSAEALDDIAQRLGAAGPGSVSVVVIAGIADGPVRAYARNADGRIDWIDPRTGETLSPPTGITGVFSIDLDPGGLLLDPPPALRDAPPAQRSFPALLPVPAPAALVPLTPEELDHRYGPPAGPKGVKEREQDQTGNLRLNPIYYRLADLPPRLVLDRPGAVWHYVVGADGQIRIGADEIKTVVTDDEWTQLSETYQISVDDLKNHLDGQGHPTIGADFDNGRPRPGPGRVSGEIRWNADSGRWEVNDKAGRYMSSKIRPDLDPADVWRWVTNVAQDLSTRLGVPVNPVLFKHAPAPAATVIDKEGVPWQFSTHSATEHCVEVALVFR